MSPLSKKKFPGVAPAAFFLGGEQSPYSAVYLCIIGRSWRTGRIQEQQHLQRRKTQEDI